MRDESRSISSLALMDTLPVSISWLYQGGVGDGGHSKAVNLTLQGTTLIPLYQSGVGDGSDSKGTQSTLQGETITTLYLGGIGDGHDLNSVKGTIAGATIAILYHGGPGDGYSHDGYNGTISGAILSSIYTGGSGDGHNQDNYSGSVSGVTLTGLYTGGNGDGHDAVSYQGTVSGGLVQALFAGGIGDGHDQLTYNGVLDGTQLSGLYGGGAGDGHDTKSFNFIIDFPDCTIVVNTADEGFGSLRYAIDCAQAGDTIIFSPALVNDSISLVFGPLFMEREVTIDASPEANLTLDGSQVSTSIYVGTLGPADIHIKGLDIVGGFLEFDAAIVNYGASLTLEDLSIRPSTNFIEALISNFYEGTITFKGEVGILGYLP